MSILIKNIDMPKNGELLCINIYPSGKVCIALDLRCSPIATAVPVPEHGRLIDADALDYFKDDIGGIAVFDFVTRGQIHAAPTIIPAEEGKA